MEYRNVMTGRVIWRPTEDEWLEASDGWARVDDDEPAAEEPPADPAEAAETKTADTAKDKERTDD